MLRSLIQSRPLLSIFLLALLVRLGAIAAFSTLRDKPLRKDQLLYHSLASSLAAGKGLRSNGVITAMVPPVYPIFLAGIYKFSGNSRIAVYFCQAALGALTVVLIFLLGRLTFTSGVGWISAVVAAVYLPFITTGIQYLSETLFTPLFLAATYCSILAVREKKTGISLLTGGLLALAALTRSMIFYFPPVILGLLAWDYLKRRDIRPIKCGFVILVAFGAVYSPWVVRNYLEFHAPVFTSTNTGMVAYTSLFPYQGKIFGNNLEESELKDQDRYIVHLNEIEMNRALQALAWKEMRNEPLRPVRLIPLKTAYFWSPFDWEVLGQPRGTINFWFIWILLFSAVWLFRRKKWHSSQIIPFSLIAYFYLLSLAAYGSPRMRLPIEPLLILLAAEGWVGIETKLDRKLKFILAFFIVFTIIACSIFGYELKELSAALLSRFNLW
ncbi:MAG: hypothetical protein A3F83_08125 [Candidatus Glassbacteria bacterium RIFCSPLOWO2_12_FULL_58_11]|uniref:Glycosyltransferase RgtA/B/C/D-like domain-containing protein n=1 Tax=Candidatus Glassbacteria bacterium RIFCSPLOWO2_12_FULL_58_11 TaxID=1817867 RepID=A0A1F5YKD6_9BACT|nr:MAG: hypothetical protein A3F83_08125 [Candidatus Glassbacteria bacterium RIFCSPLOWO2_12_FULL_58_11]